MGLSVGKHRWERRNRLLLVSDLSHREDEIAVHTPAAWVNSRAAKRYDHHQQPLATMSTYFDMFRMVRFVNDLAFR